MAKFLLGICQESEVSVNKTDSKWMVDFTLPDNLRDTMSMNELRRYEGVFLMTFYDAPMVGDLFEYKGFQWRIIQRYHYAHRHRKHEPRHISRLGVEFVGPVEDAP